VNSKPVTADEQELATKVLAIWNELTGQQLRSKDWLAKIVMRQREHPEATEADHRHLIKRNLARPWWTGPPNPSVIYGSGAQFERSVLAASSNGASGRSLTPAEIIEIGKELDW
jgi:hypothetical protein